MRILVLNAGSSSLKASVVDGSDTLLRTSVAWGDGVRDRRTAMRAVLESLDRAHIAAASLQAVGHRVVHGGGVFEVPVVLDEPRLDSIAGLGELAPLHNRIAVDTIRAAQVALAGVPHVACFDTAFHSNLPEAAARYPVPESWHADWGIRRFGFHGLSVEWAVSRAGDLLGRPRGELDIVVAHLGSGCSVTAVRGGRSVATSMGFTPLEGLMMGTRSGSIDPGILLHLLRTRRADVDTLAEDLEHRSGLLGVSGRTSDVRQIEVAASSGDRRARLALDMFIDRAATGIGGAAVALNRLDALVFTGGIGENAGRIRAAIVERLGIMGIRPITADESGDDRLLAAATRSEAADATGAPVLRIEAREDLVIAGAVSVLLGQPGA